MLRSFAIPFEDVRDAPNLRIANVFGGNERGDDHLGRSKVLAQTLVSSCSTAVTSRVAESRIRPEHLAMYGPYIHTLNKGGLAEIRATSRLRATAASNNMASDRIAVRAYVGTFEYQQRNKRWSGKQTIHIEFLTSVPPRSGLPPGSAEWTDGLVGGYLPIIITRVLHGDGSYAH